jgi:MFS family permease
MSETPVKPQVAWYREVTRYQWIVLIIASAGWIFDIYENQIFNITRGPLMQELLGEPANSPNAKYYGDVLLGVFLVGGATGGILFGMLADKWGRGWSMILSILVYSVFSALTAAATEMWQVAVLRFIVAMGTGGEWAVAAALVSEVFPPRSRAYASGIFHASSVLAVAAAAGAGMIAGSNWRIAYLLGLAPAALVLAVRIYIREPRRQDREDPNTPVQQPAEGIRKASALGDVWGNARYRNRAILGLLLAAVGLAGYWGVFVAGQNLAEARLLSDGYAPADAAKKAQFAYGVVQNIGNGVGLFAMGPLCAVIGRRRAFFLMQVGALVMIPITCFVPQSYEQLLWLLPFFGLFVGGMHAGYAVYFPELFPTRQRATGAGLCFNGGRLVAAPMLWFSASLKARPDVDLRWAITLLGLIYLIGLVVVLFMPETKDQPLEE